MCVYMYVCHIYLPCEHAFAHERLLPAVEAPDPDPSRVRTAFRVQGKYAFRLKLLLGFAGGMGILCRGVFWPPEFVPHLMETMTTVPR